MDSNLQTQNFTTIPQYREGNFGLNHVKFTSTGEMQGRAEVLSDSAWKTICDDRFDMNAA